MPGLVPGIPLIKALRRVAGWPGRARPWRGNGRARYPIRRVV